ncbi:MAG: DUF222 domain-containing protein, partial [Sciscionella sp.]
MSGDQESAPLTAAEASRCSRDELLAALVDSERRTRLEESHKMILLAEAVSRDLAADTEYRSLVELLRDTLHVPRDEVTRRLTCATAVTPTLTPTGTPLPPPLPATAEALAAGQVGLDHVKVIATLHDTLPDTVHPDDWDATEHTLATLATQADSRVVARAARYARDRLDPDGREPKDTKERATRELDVHRLRDGSARCTFRLDPESAAILELLTSALGTARPTRD